VYVWYRKLHVAGDEMEKNDKVKKNKKNDKDQKQHQAQHGFDPMVDKSPARDTDQSLLMETPFYSRMDEHAATLSRIPFTVQRQEYIMRLNNTYGLRYVQRLLESVNGQAKLTVSSPGDIYEQEADKVADEVTQKINIQAQRQEVPEEEELIQGKLDIQRQEELEEEELLQAKLDIQKQEEEEEEIQAQRQEEEEEEELVQMKRDENAEADVADEIEMRINNAKGSGHSLSGEVKKPMEQAFGADFNDVKIHTDTEADTLNKQLSAKAFTTGTDIFFRDGEYNHNSDDGKKLLAHELTHVVQQNGEYVNKKSRKTYREPVQISQKGNINKKTIQRSSFPNFDQVKYPQEIEEVQYGVGEVIRFSNITSCLGIIVREDDRQVRGVHIPVQDSEGVKVTNVENIVNSIWAAAGNKATDAIFVGQVANWNRPGPDIAGINQRIAEYREYMQQNQAELDALKQQESPDPAEIAELESAIRTAQQEIKRLEANKNVVATREIYQQLIVKFNPQQQIEGEKFTAYIDNKEVKVAEGGAAEAKWEQYKAQREEENLEAHQEWMAGNIY
jgi:hypothetical protein